MSFEYSPLQAFAARHVRIQELVAETEVDDPIGLFCDLLYGLDYFDDDYQNKNVLLQLTSSFANSIFNIQITASDYFDSVSDDSDSDSSESESE
jgi:hypothetical protein